MPATAPQLDVFVDSGGDVRLERSDGTELPLPGAAPVPPPLSPSRPAPPPSAEPTPPEEAP